MRADELPSGIGLSSAAGAETFTDGNESSRFTDRFGDGIDIHRLERPQVDDLDGDAGDRELVRLGTTMLDWMWARGWDPEHGGLLYFADNYADDLPFDIAAYGAVLVIALVLFSLLFNVLTANAGDTPLFTLPALRWTITSPDQGATLIQIGGTVTLEGLVYSLTSALGLMAVLTVFATFNTLVDHYQLLRSTPRSI